MNDPSFNLDDKKDHEPARTKQPKGLHAEEVTRLGFGFNYGDTSREHFVYDAETATWSASPADIPDLDTWSAHAHTYEGKLYLIGGWPAGTRFRVYDPSTNAWTNLQDLEALFDWGFVSALVDDAIYLIQR